MAARGTGLPTIDAGAISPLVDLVGTAGAPQDAQAAALRGAARGIENINEALRPATERAAETLAARDLEADDVRPVLGLSSAGEAYNRAIQQGQLSSFTARMDAEDQALRTTHDGKPDAYLKDASEWRTNFLQQVPGTLAIEIGGRLSERIARSEVQLRAAQAQRALAESHDALAYDLGTHEQRAEALLGDGRGLAGFNTPEVQAALAEIERLSGELVGNPAFGVTPAEARKAQDTRRARLEAAAIAGHVRKTFREYGYEAALREVQDILPAGAADDAEDPNAPSARGRELAYQLSVQAIQQEQGLTSQLQTLRAQEATAAGQRARDLIEAMRYGGQVDHDELRQLAQASGDPGLIAQTDFAIEVGVQPPPGFGGGGGGADPFSGDSSTAGGFQAAVDFVIDDLEGGEAYVPDDNGRGPTRFGINATANPDLNIQGLTRGAATNRYRQRYWNAIGADNLPPALALVAFDAAVNQGPGLARQWIEESDGDVGRYLALREAHYRRLAADPDQRKNLNGWLTRLQNVRRRAARVQAFQINATGFASDPLAFAAGNASRPALAQVPALAVDAVFAPATQGQWATTIQQRRALGDVLARDYQAPRRMLTDGEAETYRNRITENPALAITLAQAATAALGGQGARDLLAEVGRGGDAATYIHVGELGRPGGAVRFAQAAATGLTLKAQGQTLSSDRRDAVNEELTTWRPLIANNPNLLSAVQNTAQAAALADEVTGVERTPEYYVQSALGRTRWNDRHYGGAAKVNGRETIVPQWLNPDYFDDAMERLADAWVERDRGPVYANGDVIPARVVAGLRPVLMPNGRYQLEDRRGGRALSRRGSPFEIDMNAGRDFLRRTLGAEGVRD